MNELLKKIQNYNTNSSIGFLFDENFAQMSHVGCLPEDVYYSFKDSKEYELSRHGITKRYQILIFPYLDDELFIAEFLAYFLKNSYMSSETLSKKEKDYFSFHLLGMHISAFTPVFADKDEEMFCYSSYLDNSYELMRQIETNNIRRCIYMLFDTYLGEGSHILGDVVLDEKIYNNVLSELCIKKLKKKQIFDFNEKTTLKNFAIKHLKSMKIAIKLFKEVSTFHPISLKTNKIRSEIMKNHEVGLIFMKRFLKDKLFSDKTNKDITNENILKYLLERTTIKGLDLIGMKTIYFDQDSFREFSQNFEKSKFFEMNIPFLVIAFAGCDAVASKL